MWWRVEYPSPIPEVPKSGASYGINRTSKFVITLRDMGRNLT